MGPFAALLLTAIPLAAPLPPGVSLAGGVQAEIVRAERAGAVAEAGGVYRKLRRSPRGEMIDFE